MTYLTAENFETEALKSPLPVLIDFYADWCGPCKMIAPAIEALDTEYDDRVKVCKVNIDEQMALAQMYGVTSIPTLIILKDGQEADKVIGFIPKETIAAKLDAVLV